MRGEDGGSFTGFGNTTLEGFHLFSQFHMFWGGKNMKERPHRLTSDQLSMIWLSIL